jgi:hypothetical protein
MTSSTIPYGTVIVSPGTEVTEGTTDTEFEAARRAEDAALTESLRIECQARSRSEIDESVFVFSQPDADHPADRYEAFVRDVAQAIADRAQTSRPIPREDALGLFDTAAEWMQEFDNFRGDDIPVQRVFERWGRERLLQIKESILAKYRKMVAARLSYGGAILEAYPEQQAAAIAKEATDEFRGEFEALHREIRRAVIPGMVRVQSEIIRDTLVRQIPGMVVDRRLERVKESRRGMSANEQYVLGLI